MSEKDGDGRTSRRDEKGVVVDIEGGNDDRLRMNEVRSSHHDR